MRLRHRHAYPGRWRHDDRHARELGRRACRRCSAALEALRVSDDRRPAASPPVKRRLTASVTMAYGFGSVAYGVKDAGFGTFLLLFYNQVIGLPAATVGLVIMARAADRCVRRSGGGLLVRPHAQPLGAAAPVDVRLGAADHDRLARCCGTRRASARRGRSSGCSSLRSSCAARSVATRCRARR